MWNLLVFGALGLLTGAAARLMYPDRRATHILGSMLIGMIGAVVGGMMSWLGWPNVDGEFHTGNLTFSAIGAMALIAIWAGISYQRRLRA